MTVTFRSAGCGSVRAGELGVMSTRLPCPAIILDDSPQLRKVIAIPRGTATQREASALDSPAPDSRSAAAPATPATPAGPQLRQMTAAMTIAICGFSEVPATDQAIRLSPARAM
jgi:hypothetical protein